MTVEGENFTANLDNSVLKISGGDAPGSLSLGGSGNVFNVENGSRLIVANATVGADNAINVDGASLEIGTLTNNGTVTVTGESMLNIGTVTGEEIEVLDGAVITDSNIGGAVNLTGGNTVWSGNNTVSGIFSAGYYNYGGDLTTDITGTFNSTNMLVWAQDGYTSVVNIGSADADRTAFNGGQIGEQPCQLTEHEHRLNAASPQIVKTRVCRRPIAREQGV